jgi:hypothetical protein
MNEAAKQSRRAESGCTPVFALRVRRRPARPPVATCQVGLDKIKRAATRWNDYETPVGENASLRLGCS